MEHRNAQGGRTARGAAQACGSLRAAAGSGLIQEGPEATRSPAWRRIATPAVLFGLVVALYLPSIRNDFIYDDHLLIAEAPAPRSADDVLRVFAERHWHNLPYYRPIARLTMVVQKGLHGNAPAPYHLFNVLLMGGTAVLADALLRRPAFAIRPPVAFLGAALFTFHPIASSTVYPICSGRETLMPTLLTIAAVHAFLHAGTGWYVLATCLLGAALLSKEQAVVAPGLFVLADVLGLSPGGPGRSLRRWVIRYLPFGLMVVGYLLLRRQVLGDEAHYRLAVLDHPFVPLASLAYAFQTMVVPFVGLVYEPRIEVWPSAWRQLLWPVAAAGIAVVAYRSRPTVRAPVIFWLGWCLVALLPTANLLAQEARFDERYAFLALLGVVGIVAVLVSAAWERARVRRLALLGGLALTAAAAAVSVHRSRYFRSDLDFLQQWLRTDPDSAEAHYNLANQLRARAALGEAVHHYRRALALAPDSAEIHNNLGITLGMQGHIDEAAAQYAEAVRLAPEYAIAHNNLGTALRAGGNLDAAVEHFRRAAQLDAALVEAHRNLATTLAARDGATAEAVAAHRHALTLRPDDAEMHHALGNLLLQQGALSEAIDHYRSALALAPRSAETEGNLGWALQRAGRATAALNHFRRGVKLAPDHPPALAGAAWVLATHPDARVRHPDEAVRLAEHAAELTRHRQARILDVLAAAYAAAGRFDRAVATAAEALRLATAAEAHDLAAAVAARLARYQRNEPYREP